LPHHHRLYHYWVRAVIIIWVILEYF
jgi:hypothetical protein